MKLYELYNGKDKNPASVCVQMLRAGQASIRKERTRWHRNRQMYLGNQWLRVMGSSVRTLTPAEELPGGRRRETANRLRSFVDGRVAMLTWKRPNGRVIPDNHDMDTLEAARTADSFLAAKGHSSEWGLQDKWRQLGLAAEIDGIAWLNVIYDPSLGKTVRVNINTQTGEPVAKREELEALKAQDPNGEVLWTQKSAQVGEVVFRVVRAGSIAFDPLAAHSFDEAQWVIESRIRSVGDVEREAKKPMSELVNESKGYDGTTVGTSASREVDTGSVSYEDDEGEQHFSPRSRSVVVHEGFIKPTGPNGDWPQGLHIKWVEHAPNAPYVVEPWEDDLPYMPYTPRPHGASLAKSKGIVDDLYPLQIMFNRRLTQLGEWMDRVARPPLILQGGGLHADTPRLFNKDGFVIVKPGMGDPRFMNVPGEPTALLTQHLQFILDQMAEVSLQQNPARGTPPGGGVDAAVGINLLIQQNEQQMSGTAGQLVKVIEWGVSRGLKLVAENYSIPRLVASPGISTSVGFDAFVGEKIRGATKYRIQGSLLPRSQAAQASQFMQFYQLSGGKFDASPYLSQFLEGDIDEIISREREQYERQRYEINIMLSLAKQDGIDEAWKQYEEVRMKYMESVKQLAGQVDNPIQFLASQGVQEPTLADVGIDLPPVEDFDDDPVHLRAVAQFCSGDAYFKLHPLVKHALFEHRKRHKEQIGRNMSAQQQAEMQLQPGKEPGGGVNTGGPAQAQDNAASESDEEPAI